MKDTEQREKPLDGERNRWPLYQVKSGVSLQPSLESVVLSSWDPNANRLSATDFPPFHYL